MDPQFVDELKQSLEDFNDVVQKFLPDEDEPPQIVIDAMDRCYRNICIYYASKDRAYKQFLYSSELSRLRHKQDGRKSTDMKDVVFLTVNPPEMDPEELYDLLKRFVKSKSVEWYLASIEQRSEDDNWRGFHLHILFKRSKEPSRIKAWMKKVFEDYPRKIYSFDQDDHKEHIKIAQYVIGNKKDQSKSAKCAQDKDFRKHYNFEPYLVCDAPLYLLGGGTTESLGSESDQEN